MANKIQVLLKFIVSNNRVGSVRQWDQDETTQAFKMLLKDVEPYCNHFDNGFKIGWLTVGKAKRKVRCLYMATTDGHWYPVTQNKLIGKKESARAKTLRLMREAIEDQIITFKEEFKENQVRLINSGQVVRARELAKCPLTGKIMTRVHVDHVLPFIVLADLWLETHTIHNKFSEVKATEMASWSAFHKRFSTLALVGAKANMDKG